METTKTGYNLKSVTVPVCNRCGKQKRIQKREFSENVLHALVSWQELDEKDAKKGICDECYSEIRNILIENSDELLAATVEYKSQEATI